MHHFSWLGYFTHDWINHKNVHIFSAGLVVLFLIVATLLVHRKLKRVEERVIPDSKTTLVNIFEMAVESLMGLMEGIMGHDAKKYFPLIGSIFIYIFLCNIMGLIPGFLQTFHGACPLAWSPHGGGRADRPLCASRLPLASSPGEHHGRPHGPGDFFQPDSCFGTGDFFGPRSLCLLYPGVRLQPVVDDLHQFGDGT